MAEPTKTHPFFQSPFSRQPGGVNRRRSTRVDLALPVILSGRDASGETFREETQTETVNLHGAKVETSRNVLVGMQVSIESPLTGAVEKAVCVRVFENIPGSDRHHIATQLVRPGNIWGIEDPPADWNVVAANMLGASQAPSRSIRVIRPGLGESAQAMPILESQAVTAEQQAASLAESVLEIFRQQIQAVADATLQSAEARLKQMEADAASQMAAERAEVVAAAAVEIRARVAEVLAPLAAMGSGLGAEKPAGTLSRK